MSHIPTGHHPRNVAAHTDELTSVSRGGQWELCLLSCCWGGRKPCGCGVSEVLLVTFGF